MEIFLWNDKCDINNAHRCTVILPLLQVATYSLEFNEYYLLCPWTFIDRFDEATYLFSFFRQQKLFHGTSVLDENE